MVEEKKTAEEKKISVGEIRRTISTSLGTAFGFVIALLWSNVVLGGLKAGGVRTDLATINLGSWIVFMLVSLVLTVIMVVLIIVVSRWGGK
jgi:Family of unknown function (DUF5654)